MTDANGAIKPLHDRMPVFLFPTEWDAWLRGSFDDLLALQARKFPDEPIEINRTIQLWVPKKTKATV
jgi:putative SOS response-associated peptidase YedK